MSISVTNIGGAVGTSSAAIAVPAGGIPAGAVIVVIAQGAANNYGGGTISGIIDSKSNTYTDRATQALPVNAGNLYVFTAPVTTALVSGNTITVSGSSLVIASAIYVTGVSTSGIDTAVSNSNSGDELHNSSVASLTSGTPSVSGEIFIAATALYNGSASSSYSAPAGWSSFTAESDSTSGYEGYLGGAYIVQTGSAATETYAPTTNNNIEYYYANIIIGLKAGPPTGSWASTETTDTMSLDGTPETTTFTSGSGNYIVPEYATLTVEVWGGGASGSGPSTGSLSVYVAGTAGNASSVSTLSMTANGGGAPASVATPSAPTGGSGGTASGGNTTNTTGTAGQSGNNTLNGSTGAGGAGADGGAGGASVTPGTGTSGNPGVAPGGGGGGSGYDYGSPVNTGRNGAGGGGGGYSKSVYTFGAPGAPTVGESLAYAVGASATGPATYNGATAGGGAAGQVRFTVTPSVNSSATWASTEGTDVLAFLGSIEGGHWASTEVKDALAFIGHPELPNGPWASTEADDVFAARGGILGGVWASIEAADIFAAIAGDEGGVWASVETTDIFDAVGPAYITGVTRNEFREAVGSVTVMAFYTATNVLYETTVSDVDGNFSIGVPRGVEFYLVGYLHGSPDTFGTTLDTLMGD